MHTACAPADRLNCVWNFSASLELLRHSESRTHTYTAYAHSSGNNGRLAGRHHTLNHLFLAFKCKSLI